jgi:hypothetical protein
MQAPPWETNGLSLECFPWYRQTTPRSWSAAQSNNLGEQFRTTVMGYSSFEEGFVKHVPATIVKAVYC